MGIAVTVFKTVKLQSQPCITFHKFFPLVPKLFLYMLKFTDIVNSEMNNLTALALVSEMIRLCSCCVNKCVETAGNAKAGLLLGRKGLWGALDLLLHLKPCSSNYLPPFPCPYSHFSSSNGARMTGQYNPAQNVISPLSAQTELSSWTKHRAGARPR